MFIIVVLSKIFCFEFCLNLTFSDPRLLHQISGQRSSSLHYAACFGRPQIAKVLLRHGANPDLRDEDGKTPLDKARERNDEGHREVAAILQSPAEWLVVAENKVITSI